MKQLAETEGIRCRVKNGNTFLVFIRYIEIKQTGFQRLQLAIFAIAFKEKTGVETEDFRAPVRCSVPYTRQIVPVQVIQCVAVTSTGSYITPVGFDVPLKTRVNIETGTRNADIPVKIDQLRVQLKPQALDSQWLVKIEGNTRQACIGLVDQVNSIINHLEIIDVSPQLPEAAAAIDSVLTAQVLS